MSYGGSYYGGEPYAGAGATSLSSILVRKARKVIMLTKNFLTLLTTSRRDKSVL